MGTITWKQGTAGNWFTSANWTPQGTPATGDTVVIVSGTPTIPGGSPAIIGEQIVLGGLASATLVATNATFAGTPSAKDEVNATFTAVGGEPTSPAASVVFRAEGATSFDGQIFVNVLNGSLAIEAVNDGFSPGNFTLLNTDLKATVLVNQESLLWLKAGTITNGGLIQVEGGAEVASGVTVAGTGIFELDQGGRLMVRGAVGAGQQIDLMDKTPFVTLAAGSQFDGVFGFTPVGGARIDLGAVQAQSAQLLEGSTGQPDTLNLFSGAGGTGTIVARLKVQLVDANLFPLSQQTLTGNDFAISADGTGGTLVRYAPQGSTYLDQSLAVPITAPVGSMVSLPSILKQSFGTEAPGFKSYILLPSKPFENSTTDVGYWTGSNVTPTWYLNGAPVTTVTRVLPGDTVELLVGNQINNPARFQVQVTDASSGTSAEYINYTAWSVAPEIANAVKTAGFAQGAATPAAVVASASAYAAAYGLINNTNLCNWIADNVAAGAGATLPPDSISLDPSLNLEGGFWRIAYAAAGPSPAVNWSGLVQPGDIVRMGWFKPEQPTTEHVSGHTTTVLGAVDASGKITVYDNTDYVNGVEYIGTHTANFWVATNPADITIYRLDPNHQYLIQGTALSENLQGSVYDNLIRPGGGNDVIRLGATNSTVEGTVAQLKAITITDFDRGDVLSFTDLASANAGVAYEAGQLHVRSNGQEVAAVTMPSAGPAEVFQLLPQSGGGSFVSLGLAPTAQVEGLYVGYLARAGDPAGALYWQQQLAIGGGGLDAWRSLAASYATQAEAKAEYPFFVDPQHATAAQRIAFVNSVYQVLFNRTADAAGLDYWQDYLAKNAGNARKVGTVILDIIEGVSHTSGSTDLSTFNNKVTVATFFTQQLSAAHLTYDAAAAALAHNAISQTSSSAASVVAAEASIIGFINSHAPAASTPQVVGILPDSEV